ncbi:MAG: hypothetical protein ACM3OC_05735 [Deltaproteobacteria bacterium]
MKKLTFLCIAFLLVSFSTALAALNVSVTPFEGGFNLDFGKVTFTPANTQRQVTVRIDNTAGGQYRLVQTMLEPLISAKGDVIRPENFTVYSLRGSNTNGTLYTDYEIPVTPNRTPIFMSNPQGSPVTFTLVYVIKGPCSAPSGQYRGRLRYTLEPVSAPIQQVEAFLDVIAEIQQNEANITISTPTGMKTISVKLTKEGVEGGDVLFSFKNIGGNQGRIFQSFVTPITAVDGTELDPALLTVQTEGQPAVEMNGERQNIFTSLPSKDGDVKLTYGFGSGAINAGTYRSTIKYSLEGSRGQQDLGTFQFEASVEKIFDLALSTENGGGTISFRDIKPRQPARTFEVNVAVKTNTGKKYQVTQKNVSGLVNKEGQSIPEQYFTVVTQNAGSTKGTLKCPEKTTIKPGDIVLFVSDNKGSPDSFRIIYELSTPESVKAGDYSASIVYSLSEI